MPTSSTPFAPPPLPPAADHHPSLTTTATTGRSTPLPRGRTRALVGALLAAVAIAGSVALDAPTAGAHAPARLRECRRSDLSTYTVGSGDSWFDISRAVSVKMRDLLDVNGADDESTIYPGDVLCLPQGADAAAARRSGGCASDYAVRRGDSWFTIAKAVGVSMGQLFRANGADEDTAIHPGSTLCLPAGASAPPSAAATGMSRGVNGLLAFPLQGPCWFGNTWHAARGNGRRHVGVDLIAEQGKYVYAVTDGTLTQRAWDQPGRLAGNAWWLTADDGSGTYYFYAHLYAFAPGLKVGSKVRAGEIIGFVGTTGSSATPHLHFEMHPGGGGAINPYDTIKAMGGCRTEMLYRQPSGWTPEG